MSYTLGNHNSYFNYLDRRKQVNCSTHGLQQTYKQTNMIQETNSEKHQS